MILHAGKPPSGPLPPSPTVKCCTKVAFHTKVKPQPTIITNKVEPLSSKWSSLTSTSAIRLDVTPVVVFACSNTKPGVIVGPWPEVTLFYLRQVNRRLTHTRPYKWPRRHSHRQRARIHSYCFGTTAKFIFPSTTVPLVAFHTRGDDLPPEGLPSPSIVKPSSKTTTIKVEPALVKKNGQLGRQRQHRGPT